MKKITLLIFLLPLLVKAQPIINLEDFDYQGHEKIPMGVLFWNQYA